MHRKSGATEVLDASDNPGGVQVEATLDEDLLGEGVAALDRGPLCRPIFVEGFGGEHGNPADAVAAGLGAKEDDEIACPRGCREVDVLDPHGADTQGVDQRIALVALIKDGFAADIWQAEAVAVSAHSRHDSRQHAGSVGVIERAEPQWVHHGDRPRAH